MKTLALFISLMSFWTLNSNGQSEDVSKLLENQQTRTEIFNSILNSHTLMTEFIHAMNGNDHAMMMMNENYSMMGNGTDTTMQMGSGYHMSGMMGQNHQGMMGQNHQEMMGQNHQEMMNQMMGYLNENPELIPQMMGNMMAFCEKDTTQCNQIARVMSEHPQMMMMGMQQMNHKQSGDLNTHMNMMGNSGETTGMGNHHMNNMNK